MNEDFKYILAIAEHGSISKAARAVNISQPGLSQRLRRLESQMGTELFSRESYPLKPTPTGEVFLKYAQRAVAAEDGMRRELHGIMSHRKRRLRIGVSTARANALLAEPIVSFYETHQGCTVELKEMATLDQMHALFLNDGIDCAVLTPIAPDPALYETEVLCRERLLVVASAGLDAPQLRHVENNRVSVRRLEGIPFVLPSCGSYFDPLISQMIDVAHAQLDIVVRDCSAELALALVADGLGVSIVPSTWVAKTSSLQTYEIEGFEAGNVLRYIRRADREPSNEEALFVNILRESICA